MRKSRKRRGAVREIVWPDAGVVPEFDVIGEMPCVETEPGLRDLLDCVMPIPRTSAMIDVCALNHLQLRYDADDLCRHSRAGVLGSKTARSKIVEDRYGRRLPAEFALRALAREVLIECDRIREGAHRRTRLV